MEGAVLSTLLNLIVIFPAIGAIVVALIRNDKVSSRLAKAVAVIEYSYRVLSHCSDSSPSNEITQDY